MKSESLSKRQILKTHQQSQKTDSNKSVVRDSSENIGLRFTKKEISLLKKEL